MAIVSRGRHLMGRRKRNCRPVQRIVIRVGALQEVFPLATELLVSRARAIRRAQALHDTAFAALSCTHSLNNDDPVVILDAPSIRFPTLEVDDVGNGQSPTRTENGGGSPGNGAFPCIPLPRDDGGRDFEWPIE
jgi:hypothetical protein